jgi:hypothetical protein
MQRGLGRAGDPSPASQGPAEAARQHPTPHRGPRIPTPQNHSMRSAMSSSHEFAAIRAGPLLKHLLRPKPKPQPAYSVPLKPQPSSGALTGAGPSDAGTSSQGPTLLSATRTCPRSVDLRLRRTMGVKLPLAETIGGSRLLVTVGGGRAGHDQRLVGPEPSGIDHETGPIGAPCVVALPYGLSYFFVHFPPLPPSLSHRSSFFGAGPRGVCAPPGPLFRVSPLLLGGPGVPHKAWIDLYFDLTLSQGLPQRRFAPYCLRFYSNKNRKRSAR